MRRHGAAGAGHPHRRGVRRLDGVDDDALPAADAGVEFVDYTTIGCGIARGGPYRYDRPDADPETRMRDLAERWAQRISHDQPDVVLLIIGRWETVDRVNEGHWTHVGDPAFDAYLRGELQRALDILGSTGARVVVTTEPYNRRGEKADGSLYPEDQPDRVDRWNTLLRSVVGQRPNVDGARPQREAVPERLLHQQGRRHQDAHGRGAPDAGSGEVADAVAGGRAAQVAIRDRR